MPVSTEASTVSYTGNGATVAFPTTFKFLLDTDLVVERKLSGETDFAVVDSGDYAITGTGEDAGGTVTMETAPAVASTLRITRTVPYTQLLTLQTNGPFPPRQISNSLDKLTMAAQQLQRSVDLTSSDLQDAISGIVGSDVGAAFGFLTPSAPLTTANALQVRARSDGRKLQIAEHGGRWRTILPGDNIFDVRDFAGVGQVVGVGDETADTDAILAAFAALSCDFGTGAGYKPGAIFFPMSISRYQLASPVRFLGNASYAHTFFGEIAPGAPSGPHIDWVGDAGETMFHFYGLCNGQIRNLGFNCRSIAARAIHIESAQGLGFSSSTHNHIMHCIFGEARDNDSIHIALGGDSGPQYQCDQVSILDCGFSGGIPRKGIAIKELQGGNCKNLKVRGGVMTFLDKGVVFGGSGSEGWSDTVMAEINTPFEAGGNALIYLKGLQCEGCKVAGFWNVGVGNPGRLSMVSCQWFVDTENPDDSVVLNAQCGLYMEGNQFFNSTPVAAWQASHAFLQGQRRSNDSGKCYEVMTSGTSAGSGGPTGTNTRITDGSAVWMYVGPVHDFGVDFGNIGNRAKVAGGGLDNKQTVSLNNYFQDLGPSRYAPIFDGGGNNMLGSDQVNAYAQIQPFNVVSLGDSGGIIDGEIFPYYPAIGLGLNQTFSGMATPHPDGTPLGLGELHVGLNRVEFTFADFSAAATSKILNVFQTQGDNEVRGTWIRVVTAFAGVTSPVFRLGSSSGDDDIITDKSATSITLIGNVKSELNTSTGKFWDPLLLQPNGCRAVGENTSFHLKLSSSAGNLSSLTAGKVVLIIELARIP